MNRNLNPRQFLSMSSNVARAHGFQHVPDEQHPDYSDDDLGVNSSPDNWIQLGHREVVHTRQPNFYKPGLRQYIDTPNDPHEFKEDVGMDVPQVYRHGGKLWMGEGHHRLLASRLRGDRSTTVAMRDIDAERGS